MRASATVLTSCNISRGTTRVSITRVCVSKCITLQAAIDLNQLRKVLQIVKEMVITKLTNRHFISFASK